MYIYFIVAVDSEWGISRKGKLPWRNTQEGRMDMDWFTDFTIGTAVIMGRKTFESIPMRNRPLHGRVNIVISSANTGITTFGALTDSPVVNVNSFDTAVKWCDRAGYTECVVAGGNSVYEQALKSPYLCHGYITVFDGKFDCDRFFPFQYLENIKYDSHHNCGAEYRCYNFVNCDELAYSSLLRKTLDAPVRPTRTGIAARGVFSEVLKFQLYEPAHGRILPLLTQKKMTFAPIYHELIWFLRGSTNTQYLRDNGVKIWDGNTTREFLDSRGLTDYVVGEVGPCFPAGTKVLTLHGYRDIESVKIGELLYTDIGNWKPVSGLHARKYSGNMIKLKLQLHPRAINSTPEHPFLARVRGEAPAWVAAKDLTPDHFIGFKIETKEISPPFDKRFDLGTILKVFDLTIPDWVHKSPKCYIMMFLNQWHTVNISGMPFDTAMGLHRLYYKLGQPTNVKYDPRDDTYSIELCNNTCSYIDNGYVWYAIEEIANCEFSGKVFNFEVADDNTYTVENAIVHNCYGYQWRSWNRSYKGSNASAEAVGRDVHSGDNSHGNTGRINTNNDNISERRMDVNSHGSIGRINDNIDDRRMDVNSACDGCARMCTRGDHKGVDQLACAINTLKTDPWDRRMVISAWNVEQLPAMALPACHYSFQFHVDPDARGAPTYLNCLVNMRSTDIFLGLPFNIASYALLTHIVSHITSLTPGTLSVSMCDVHLYLNAVEPAKIQLLRRPRRFPTIRFSERILRDGSNIDQFASEYTIADYIVEGYEPHPRICAVMAV